MLKYQIVIEETIFSDFDVEAASPEEARSIAQKKYMEGKFVLDNPCLAQKRIAVNMNEENVLDFVEF